MSGILQGLIASISGAAAAVSDAYFNLVTLLLNTSSTNGAQNNTFIDSSSNGFTITRNPASGPNAPTQGTFSPFSQTGWGNYFGGSGNYLSNTSAALIGATTTTFTAEAWIYMTAAPTSDANNIGSVVSLDGQAAGTVNYLAFGPISNQKLYLRWFDSAAKTCNGSTTLALNTWYHIALVVNSNAISMYVNGVAETLTGTTTLTNRGGTSGNFAISANNYSAFSGYISNLRVCTSAVYTSGFTPSTTPLTTTSQSATGCILLTCQNNRFVDNSSNGYTLTVGGTPSVQAFSPFAPASAYSVSTVGGSGYFDGTGDYLSIADSATLEPGASTFTLECWFYSTANPPANGATILSKSATSSFGPFAILIDPSTKYINGLASTTGSSWNISIASTTVAVLNTWYHVALVRSGSNFALFINGTRAATASSAGTLINNTDAFMVGYDNYASTNFTGYISGVRYVVGTAVYDPTLTTCTIPTAPANPTGSTLCINFTNAGIYDAAAKNDLETVGDAQVSTTQAKFGTTSMKFNGTTDYLYVPLTTNFRIKASFTIESFIYITTRTNFVMFSGSTTSGAGGNLYLNESGGSVLFGDGTANIISFANTSLPLNQWFHCAITFDGTTYRIFVDGTSVGTSTTALSDYTINSMQIGARTAASIYISGYIDEFRLTKGYARYTANFTPPTAAFPVQ